MAKPRIYRELILILMKLIDFTFLALASSSSKNFLSTGNIFTFQLAISSKSRVMSHPKAAAGFFYILVPLLIKQIIKYKVSVSSLNSPDDRSLLVLRLIGNSFRPPD
jgi:hypothetical protein